MPDKKISDLAAAAALDGTEIVPVVQSAATVRTTAQAIAARLTSSGGADLTQVSDTNITLALGGTPAGALLKAASITVGWAGTLAAVRLNSNVVQAITNDTNVTGSIANQVLTLGWTGTLAAGRGGTGINSLGAGIATWLGTPSSANLASAITDETGSGALVFGTSPTFTTGITVPQIYGGSATNSSLILQASSNGGAAVAGQQIVLSVGGAAGITIDRFQQTRFGSNIFLPNNTALSAQDSGGVDRTIFFVSPSDMTVFKVGKAGGTISFQDNGFTPLLTFADGGTAPIKFASTSIIANGSVATAITSVGPTGSNTTVQEWLQVRNASGTIRYIPCF
jgi:hypothetical protein